MISRNEAANVLAIGLLKSEMPMPLMRVFFRGDIFRPFFFGAHDHLVSRFPERKIGLLVCVAAVDPKLKRAEYPCISANVFLLDNCKMEQNEAEII